jgi:Lrp/AsnC family transcriptional regulator for asnA, asnC and gidA
MDSLDLKIIEFLQQDGRMPYTEIAQELEVSDGTIRNRVTRLIENGTLHIVGMTNPAKLGFDTPAFIGVSIQGADIESVAETISNFEEVSYLIMVSGEFDLILEVLCKDRDHLANFLNQKLRKVNGVAVTQSFIILQTFKMAYGSFLRKNPGG